MSLLVARPMIKETTGMGQGGGGGGGERVGGGQGEEDDPAVSWSVEPIEE